MLVDSSATTKTTIDIMPPSSSSNNSKKIVQATASNYVPPQPSYLFEYVLDPIYTWIAQFYPRWLTPNSLTLLGITSTCLASLLYCAFIIYPNANDPITGAQLGSSGFDKMYDVRFTTLDAFGQFNSDFNAAAAKNYSTPSLPKAMFTTSHLEKGAIISIDAPQRWVLILVGIMNILYMICDNTDGKQARRYNMCSTIGEYLDHGMDAVVFVLSVFVLSSCLFERVTVALMVQAFLGTIVYMTHSVNYSAGIMIWGNRFVSVDEGTLLFSVGPLFVGFFPHVMDRVFPFGALRVVQVVYFFLIASQLDTMAKLVRADRKVLNFGLFSHVLCVVAMIGWGIWHKGGTSPEVSGPMMSIHKRLTPYAEWEPNTSQHNVLVVFLAALVKCAALFVRNVLCCYPALFAITNALIASITSHIAVAAKTLFQPRESWTPIGFLFFGIFFFGFHPPFAVLFLFVGHAIQIRHNLVQLVSPAHLAKLKH